MDHLHLTTCTLRRPLATTVLTGVTRISAEADATVRLSMDDLLTKDPTM